MMKLNRKLVIAYYYWFVWLTLEVASQPAPPPAGVVKSKRPIYDLVDWTFVTPKWLAHDEFETTGSKQGIRYPHPQQRNGITEINQELVLLSTQNHEVAPSCQKSLEIQKKARRFIKFHDYQPVRTAGVRAKHYYAERLGLRRKTFGQTDEMLIPLLYLPSGWPLMLFLFFVCWIFAIPMLGGLLIEVGSKIVTIFKYFLWGPVKRFLRMILIIRERNKQSWIRFLAPAHFLEPRSTWKMPYLLRHDYVEDIPPELAYKPPINKIDYTLYILNEEDYDDADLEMDELEVIDELLQFKDKNPNAVARLLKHRLGVEKFYNYFDEDILSDEEDVASTLLKDEKAAAKEDEEEENAKPDYLYVLENDEPWMHPEFDDTFDGTMYELEEIRQRREVVREVKEEVLYLHDLIQRDKQYSGDLSELPEERKVKLQKKAKKLLDNYVRFSRKTKERIEEKEPSPHAKQQENVAFSKYLPLVGNMSHFNHRLNLRHDKQINPERRQKQLETFGGP